MINAGRVELLGTIDGSRISNTSINITYQYAHGIDIIHANELPEDSNIEPDFTVSNGKNTLGYVYIEEPQIATFSRSKNLTVAVLKPFQGEVQIKNNVCGCEAMLNMIYFAGGAVTSLILILIAAGFYYSARNNSLNNLILPEKDY